MNESPEGLLSSLDGVSARLPGRTLLALAWASVRVRLVRSSVTTASVVLAVAYLVYSGASSALVRRLVLAEDDRLLQLLLAAGVNADAARAGSPLDRWLMLMALLTCTVGIANAMLMSVTERFREIGTMKCLGAENATVVRLFLIESALLGLVGAAAGLVVGLGIALAVAVGQFGGFVWAHLRWTDLLTSAGLSALTGIVLCLIGAGYPAFIAARMRPVDALRVEE